jgi:hypothetical protein
MTVKQSLERLVQAGRRTGLTDLQIGDDIRRELKGELPDVTIRKYLPSSMKHQEMSRQPNTNNKFAIHVSQNEPKIPPPTQEIKEVIPDPPFTEEERNKVHKIMDTVTIATHPRPDEIILDCKKFRTELRVGTLNNSKLKLKIDKYEVVKIE